MRDLTHRSFGRQILRMLRGHGCATTRLNRFTIYRVIFPRMRRIATENEKFIDTYWSMPFAKGGDRLGGSRATLVDARDRVHARAKDRYRLVGRA